MKERRSYAEGERVIVRTMAGTTVKGLLVQVCDGIFRVEDEYGSAALDREDIAHIQIEKEEEPWER